MNLTGKLYLKVETTDIRLNYQKAEVYYLKSFGDDALRN